MNSTIPAEPSESPESPIANQHANPLNYGFILAAIVAAIAGYLALRQWGSPLTIPKELADLAPTSPPDKLAIKEAATAAMIHGNTLISLGILSSVVGAIASLVAGKSVSILRSIIGCLIGAVVIGALGVGFAWLGMELQRKLHPIPDATLSQMMKTVLLHVAFWSCQGAVLGAWIAAVRKSWNAIVMQTIGGLLGGLVSGCLYSLLAAIAFPMENTDKLIPTASANETTGIANGLFWATFSYGFIALLMVGLAKPRKTPATTANP